MTDDPFALAAAFIRDTQRLVTRPGETRAGVKEMQGSLLALAGAAGEPPTDPSSACQCGGADEYGDGYGCIHQQTGYVLCRPCGEVHRPPECAVDADGFALHSCGCRWADLGDDGPGHTCAYGES